MSPPRRPDLLALTTDGLAALANRGLVKRAAKDLDAAAPPQITVDDAATLHVCFADATEVTIPNGIGFDAASCSCGAATVCRHRVAAVLAYQRDQAEAQEATAPGASADAGEDDSTTLSPADARTRPFERWSPGEVTDEHLEAHLGPRLLGVARRAHQAGFVARVRRPTAAEPVPSVELSSCTVRFLVPHELGYAHTDAVKGSRGDAIALAVWAFREADALDADRDDLHLDVGGAARHDVDVTGLEPALVLADELLLTGSSNAGPGIVGTFARVRHHLDAANLRWPVLVLDDLDEQLRAHHDRRARYAPETFASLITEMHARSRAAGAVRTGSVPRAKVLGTEESAATPLRKAHLTGLGCRITGTADDRTAEVFFAHGATGVVLVLRKRWPMGPDEHVVGEVLARRKVVPGASLAQVAGGNIVTESATRSASRVLHVGSSRVAKTSVTPSSGGWGALPDTVLVRDISALAEELDGMAPRLIRARVEAELVRVIAVAGVGTLRYHPGRQELQADLVDANGTEATLCATHRAEAPGALDALRAALEAAHGPLTFVSGFVRRVHGHVLIDPIAVVAGARVINPDLVVGPAMPRLDADAAAEGDPLGAALQESLALLAEAAHRGLAHVPTTFVDRLDRSARRLRTVGLSAAADALEQVRAALLGGPQPEAPARWVDAHLRLLVTVENR